MRKQVDLLRPDDGLNLNQLQTHQEFQPQVCMVVTTTLLGNLVLGSQKALLIRLHIQILILQATDAS
jgi:hypothetical protein